MEEEIEQLIGQLDLDEPFDQEISIRTLIGNNSARAILQLHVDEFFNNKIAGLNPSILSLGISYPIPENAIKAFAKKISGKLFIIEDGDKFLEDKIKLLGINLIGKADDSILTTWIPEEVLEFLAANGVTLPADLLQDVLRLPANLAVGPQELAELAEVTPQARQFLAHVAAVFEQREFLHHPLVRGIEVQPGLAQPPA